MGRTSPVGWFPRRGEVYLVRLDKDRPALVISADALNHYALDVCIVPITSMKHVRFSLRVPVNPPEGGLSRQSWAKCDQVTTLDKSLLLYPPLGRLMDVTLNRVEQGIKLALQLPQWAEGGCGADQFCESAVRPAFTTRSRGLQNGSTLRCFFAPRRGYIQ
jgi:mRNA interferase MazF